MAAADRARAALDTVVAQMSSGEAREGQSEMCGEVADAIATRRHLAVRAGTGTGKSLAYLVPAVLSSRTTLIATATKALQDQLVDHDLPAVSNALERDITWAVLKGRSNYLCRQRLVEHEQAQLGLEGTDTPRSASLETEIETLAEWAETTHTGDRAELPTEPSVGAWAAVSVPARECPGASKCDSGDDCFAEHARTRASEARVVVVNTHLLGLDLSSEGSILPEHDVVIVDEAHTLAEVVSSTCGVEVTQNRFEHLARLAGNLLAESDAPERLRLRAEAFGALIDHGGDRRINLSAEPELTDALNAARQAVAQAFAEAQAVDVGDHADAGGAKARIMTAGAALIEDIDRTLEPTDTEVLFVSGDRQGARLRLAPLDVGPLLGERLFDRASVVLTSATLPPGTAAELGAPAGSTKELDVGSPFDYASKSLLYCAAHLPDVRSPDGAEAMHTELGELITAAGGRTLALFTSFRAMDAAVDALAGTLPGPALSQRDLPKRILIERFAESPSTSIFATLGFWQGIDVPGPSCILVTIDRLPFPRPDDPLLQARRDAAGPRSFGRVDLPRASVLLAQGVGRLIRSGDDEGVVAVLDQRLATKQSYRWDLIKALPPMTRTRDKAQVRARLAELDAAARADDR